MNLRAGLTIGSFTILATLATACGGGGTKTLTPDDFCTMLASAECSGSPKNCGVALDACTAARKTACTNDYVNAAKAPRTFVASNVGACISKATSVFAKQLILPSDLDALTDTCNYVFQGDVAELKACTVKYDCKSKSDICDKGQCAPKTVVGTGKQCSDFGAVCQTPQYCTTMGVAMTCVDKLGLGKTCDAMNPCDDTMMLTCTGGSCVKQSPNGGPCVTNADCLAEAPYCNPYASNKCSPGLNFSAGSNSCNDWGGTGPTTGTGGSGGSGGSGGTAGADGGTAGAGGAGGSTGAAGSDGGSADSD
jgi:hypothetical protein